MRNIERLKIHQVKCKNTIKSDLQNAKMLGKALIKSRKPNTVCRSNYDIFQDPYCYLPLLLLSSQIHNIFAWRKMYNESVVN